MPNKRIDVNEIKVPMGASIKRKYVASLKELAKGKNVPYSVYVENLVEEHLKNVKKYEK